MKYIALYLSCLRIKYDEEIRREHRRILSTIWLPVIFDKNLKCFVRQTASGVLAFCFDKNKFNVRYDLGLDEGLISLSILVGLL